MQVARIYHDSGAPAARQNRRETKPPSCWHICAVAITGRNAFGADVAYALIGWIDTQVGEFNLDNYTWPDWLLKSISRSGNRASGKGVSA